MILACLVAGSLVAQPAPSPAPARPGSAIVTPSGVSFETLTPGTGPSPTLADAVRVTYEGRLENGIVFDRADAPVGLPVAGLVPGFTEALLLMRRGGTYRFRIPPQLAYGAQGAGGVIPPNAALVFTVTLVDIGRADQPPPALPQ